MPGEETRRPVAVGARSEADARAHRSGCAAREHRKRQCTDTGSGSAVGRLIEAWLQDRTVARGCRRTPARACGHRLGVVAESASSSSGSHPLRVPQVGSSSFLSISPDGRTLAFVATGADDRVMLWVRNLATLASRPLDGTEGVSGTPFWSPDSRTLVFASQGKLRKMDATGGPSQVLCDAPTILRSGFWTADDRIVFSDAAQDLMQVPSAGGTPTPVTAGAGPGALRGIHRCCRTACISSMPAPGRTQGLPGNPGRRTRGAEREAAIVRRQPGGVRAVAGSRPGVSALRPSEW